MESHLHRTHGHQHEDPLHSTGADLHKEDEHGEEKKSTIKKVKEKVHKLKDTIKHGHGHHDEEHHNDAEKIMNESPAVRSGLMQPTDMGKPVLAEDLQATHSDILDTPARSFAQWEEEEKHGAPPPLPTGIYGNVPAKVSHHGFNQNVNREQLMGSIGKSTGVEEDSSTRNPTTAVVPANRQTDVHAPTTKTGPSQIGRHGFNQEVYREQLMTGVLGSSPNPKTQKEVTVPTNTDLDKGGIGKSTGMVQDPGAPNPTMASSPANYQTKVTDPTNTGGKEAGITDVLRSFNKMGVYDEPHSKSSDQNEPKIYTGSNDQFNQIEPKVYTEFPDQYSKYDQSEPKMYTEFPDQYSKYDQSEPKIYTESGDQFFKSNQNEPKVYAESHDHYSKSNQNEPKMYTGSHDHYSKSSENYDPKMYTGSHDQFSPEPVEDVPLSTVAGDPSSHITSYTEKTTSDKAAAAKDLMASKNERDYAHKVAEKVSGTLGPVYETVVGVGSSVMSKMQGSEKPATTRITEKEGGSVKDYFVETLKPGDEDKVVSDVITHVFHRNDAPVQEISSTSIYVRDEGGEERSLQESGK